MDQPVVITRIFKAPVERVWAAWTEPEQLQKWWGPKDFTAPSASIDLRVGGKYLFCMRGKPGPDMPSQDFWSTGTYVEIVPMKKLVCDDSFADADGNVVSPGEYGMADFPEVMRVQIDFEQLSDGTTKMTLTHNGAPAGGNADNMMDGWNQSLDKMAASVEE
jgi:uncharacterized protein YndB with AHSA1/START domain